MIGWIRRPIHTFFSDARRPTKGTPFAGTEGSKILPELKQAASDHVVFKKRYSAFYGTGLDDLLAALGARALVIGGINTHACVRTTVIDAYQRDYDVTQAREG